MLNLHRYHLTKSMLHFSPFFLKHKTKVCWPTARFLFCRPRLNFSWACFQSPWMLDWKVIYIFFWQGVTQVGIPLKNNCLTETCACRSTHMYTCPCLVRPISFIPLLDRLLGVKNQESGNRVYNMALLMVTGLPQLSVNFDSELQVKREI